jgi:hypothetical protein
MADAPYAARNHTEIAVPLAKIAENRPPLACFGHKEKSIPPKAVHSREAVIARLLGRST